MALIELDGVRIHSTRPRAIALTLHVASRRRLILLHLGLLTAAVLVAASTALGSPTRTSIGSAADARIAAEASGRSAETESSSKPATERTPNAEPPASKRQPARPARKDRVLPNPPEYPPLGRELALR